MNLCDFDILENSAVEIAQALYDNAWEGNAPAGITDFASSCVFSYTGAQPQYGDFVMHPLKENTIDYSMSVISDFPAYAPLVPRKISEPGTTDSPWKDEFLDSLPLGHFGTVLKAYGRARAQLETLNVAVKGLDTFFKASWGIPSETDLSLLVCAPRTNSITLWSQGASHFSPAAHGVIQYTPILHIEQGTISRKELSHRAGYEVSADWPRLRAVYTIISVICQVEDALVRKHNVKLSHRIQARELPKLVLPNTGDFVFPEFEDYATNDDLVLVIEKYVECARHFKELEYSAKELETVEIQSQLFINNAMLRRLVTPVLHLPTLMVSSCPIRDETISATFDLSDKPKKPATMKAVGNRRGLTKLPTIRQILQLLIDQTLVTPMTYRDIVKICNAVKYQTANEDTMSKAFDLVTKACYDTLFVDAILYLRMLGLEDDMVIDQLRTHLTRTLSVTEFTTDTDVRSWAVQFRKNRKGMLTILEMAAESSKRRFRQHTTPLTETFGCNLPTKLGFPYALSRLIKQRKQFWANRYREKALGIMRQVQEETGIQRLIEFPYHTAFDVIKTQMEAKVMSYAKFKIDIKGDVILNEESVKEAFIDSNKKFLAHMKQELPRGIEQKAKGASTLFETLVILDTERDTLCANKPYVKVSSNKLWGQIQNSVGMIQNDIVQLLADLRLTPTAANMDIPEDLVPLYIGENDMIKPTDTPPPVRKRHDTGGTYGSEPDMTVELEFDFDTDAWLDHEIHDEIDLESVLEQHGNYPDLALPHKSAIIADYPRMIKFSELDRIVQEIKEKAYQMVRDNPPEVRQTKETTSADLFSEYSTRE